MAQSIFANDNHSHYASYVDSKVSLSVEALLAAGNDSNLLIVFYVQIMPDDFVMQLHRF